MRALVMLLMCASAIASPPRDPVCGTLAETCIALAIFAEARGEPIVGQALVAKVILNRVAATPWDDDACNVVMETDQFHGIRDWPYPREPWRIDPDAWELAQQVAASVLSGEFKDIPPECNGADHFYSGTVSRALFKSMDEACIVGGHTFVASRKP